MFATETWQRKLPIDSHFIEHPIIPWKLVIYQKFTIAICQPCLIVKGYPPFLIRTENLKHRWSFRLMLSLGKLNFPSDALEWSEKELDLFVGPALSKVRTGMVLAVAELSQWCRCDWRYAQNLENHRKPTVISLGGVRHALHFSSLHISVLGIPWSYMRIHSSIASPASSTPGHGSSM